MDKVAAERAWQWVFEFKVTPGQDSSLDEENSKLFDQKLSWLLTNETDDNILRTLAILLQNLPAPSKYGQGKEAFEKKFGKQIINGPRNGPWMSGYERPAWAAKKKTPKESLT